MASDRGRSRSDNRTRLSAGAIPSEQRHGRAAGARDAACLCSRLTERANPFTAQTRPPHRRNGGGGDRNSIPLYDFLVGLSKHRMTAHAGTTSALRDARRAGQCVCHRINFLDERLPARRRSVGSGFSTCRIRARKMLHQIRKRAAPNGSRKNDRRRYGSASRATRTPALCAVVAEVGARGYQVTRLTSHSDAAKP